MLSDYTRFSAFNEILLILQVIEKTFTQIIQFGRLKAWSELHPFGMLCGVPSAIHCVPSLEPVRAAARIWVFRPCIPPKTWQVCGRKMEQPRNGIILTHGRQ